MDFTIKENLDERLERMKKRNEEIEKKYREAEADRLLAQMRNALVETKPPKDDDWPKGHKYDTVDYMYDVKPEKIEQLKESTKLVHETKEKLNYKKFPEGKGPPADPIYNFLADADRDGVSKNISNISQNDRKVTRNIDKRIQHSDGNKLKKHYPQKRGSNEHNSFCGRNGKGNHNQNTKSQGVHFKTQNDQFRYNDRNNIRSNRPKEISEKYTEHDWNRGKNNCNNQRKVVNSTSSLQKRLLVADDFSKTGNNINIHSIADKKIANGGNIVITTSQTAEVRSVKLTSAPVIGTGRVGPRCINKPQFSIQSIEIDTNTTEPTVAQCYSNGYQNVQKRSPTIAIPIDLSQSTDLKVIPSNQLVANQDDSNNVSYLKSSQSSQLPPNPIKDRKNYSGFNKFNKNQKYITPNSLLTTGDEVSNLLAIDLSHKPEFAKKSLQDRITRVRQGDPVISITINNNDKSNKILNSENSSSVIEQSSNINLAQNSDKSVTE